MLYSTLLCFILLCLNALLNFALLCFTLLCFALLYGNFASLYFVLLYSTLLCFTLLCLAFLSFPFNTCFALLYFSFPFTPLHLKWIIINHNYWSFRLVSVNCKMDKRLQCCEYLNFSLINYKLILKTTVSNGWRNWRTRAEGM